MGKTCRQADALNSKCGFLRKLDNQHGETDCAFDKVKYSVI